MHPHSRLPMTGMTLLFLSLGLSACQPGSAEISTTSTAQASAATGAAPPTATHDADGSAPPIGRAAPPVLQPVTLGRFSASDDPAREGTGALRIEDDIIHGANGAVFVTERIAVIRAGDEYAKGARYADVLMVGTEQPVELRRVVEEIAPRSGVGTKFCGERPTGYLALARLVEPDGREALRMVALQGEDVPAASSANTQLCKSAQYLASL